MITSGFIDAHSHLRSTSLREQYVIPTGSLEEALLRMSAMTSVDQQLDSLVACSDLIAGGITGVQVMFHSFSDPDGYLQSLSDVVSGIQSSGIRALVILGITDQAEFLPPQADQKLLPEWLPPKRNLSHSEFAEVFQKARKMFSGVQIGIGPVGPQWCSDKLLGLIADIAQDDVRIHTHLLESKRQRSWLAENPLQRLARHKLLGAKTSLAHGVWCNSEDLKRISDHGSQLVTCPASNDYLASGQANTNDWNNHFVSFGFGLDSSSEEIRPLKTASDYLAPSVAEAALTHGGRVCTDLPTDQDRVSWQNYQEGIVDSVSVGERVLYQNGRHHNQSTVDDARGQIAETMQQELSARLARRDRIDQLLPDYLRALDQCCA